MNGHDDPGYAQFQEDQARGEEEAAKQAEGDGAAAEAANGPMPELPKLPKECEEAAKLGDTAYDQCLNAVNAYRDHHVKPLVEAARKMNQAFLDERQRMIVAGPLDLANDELESVIAQYDAMKEGK